MKGYPNVRKLMGADSYTFLIKELEKCDEKILEPLSSVDWPRDMPVKTGGGIVENISAVDVVYASSGGDEDNIFFEPANEIPMIQADFGKLIARTFNWAEYLSISLLEREKMANIARDPMEFLDKGLRLHFDKTLDRNVYKGFEKVKSTGLVNCTRVVRSMAASADSTVTHTQWDLKTADQILNDINQIISDVWQNNDCASDALPNHILIPIRQFGMIATKKVSDDATMTILEYVTKNNIAAQQGVELIISPCKWCAGVGAGSRDRMVCYQNREDRICFNLTQPLIRMTEERSDMRLKIPYIGQFSEVRFLYITTVRYLDGI